jgi:aspartate racemase
MKTIGIVAHSAEGAALCFLTTCREGVTRLGPHMHPPVVMSAIPMGLSMPAWEAGKHATVAMFLTRGVQQVADAGADFYICPDNTAHIVLEQIAIEQPIPGLHIADVVCREIMDHRWKKVGLLGTKWTMSGSVYANAFKKKGLEILVPGEPIQELLHTAIFDQLCHGIFDSMTTDMFVAAIEELKSKGAECVVLGCTEIPLIITPNNSPLPTLDSTRLLARYAVREATNKKRIRVGTDGWINLHDYSH